MWCVSYDHYRRSVSGGNEVRRGHFRQRRGSAFTLVGQRLGYRVRMADSPSTKADDNWLNPEETDWLAEATSEVSDADLTPGEAPAPTSAESTPASPLGVGREATGATRQPIQQTTKVPAAAKARPPSAKGSTRTKASTRTKRARVPRSRRAPRWRGRILPKSILGISLLMLATGVGAATAGTALYMNYQFRRDQSDALVQTFDKRAEDAVATVQAEGKNARRRIQDEIEPIRKIAATGDTLRDLLTRTEKSVWQVATLDVDGAASVGTAFVVASDSDRSFLITSFNVVRAATARPGPGITLRKGSESIDAELWTWQESRDLALLIVKRPTMPRLDWGISSDVRLGQQIFAVSGFGTAGGAITQGFIADVSSNGVQHTAALGAHFRGAPLLSDRGLVLGIASRAYEPYGFASDGVWFAPPIRATCETVLRCPPTETSGAGQVTGAGTPRGDSADAEASGAGTTTTIG